MIHMGLESRMVAIPTKTYNIFSIPDVHGQVL